ncbi:aspartate aminotransferase [Megamonas hypermegale]|uniref:pyridoxal phosphate-dependent aminotransferase n=1 Tax=Megamonas hypermegale TaxID=158847 RepID=UPI000B39A5DA|nr:pyridoxal phosphate-dependent aminotransferase [Megamonas hypermegale]OUO39499.1 aspartate aminotransferase [Megamonas hypermegale]
MKFAKRIERILPSGIRAVNEKALAMERAGEKVIHFEIGRPDFDTPEYIKKACIESIERGDVFYTSNFGDMKLREAVAKYLNYHNHIPYTKDNVLITVGLSEAIFDVLTVILDEDDEILVPNPVWVNYVNVPNLLKAKPISYDLLEKNNYQPDIEELKSKITPKTKAIVLISPNNPTGSILKKDTLEKIAELAIENDLLVLADEVYERLIFDGEKHISIASLPNMIDRTITLNGFSKAFSMTGWRVGYVAAPVEFITQVNKIHQHNVICAPSFVQKAAITALQDEKNEVEDMVKEYTRRRDYAVDAINKIDGISCLCPKGALYIFINISKLHKTSQEVADFLIENEKIALVPGSVFGSNGDEYLRMSFANSYENIVEGCKRLKNGVEKIKKLAD